MNIVNVLGNNASTGVSFTFMGTGADPSQRFAEVPAPGCMDSDILSRRGSAKNITHLVKSHDSRDEFSEH